MPNLIKIKLIAIVITGFFISAAVPAQANAPLQKAVHFNKLALQNPKLYALNRLKDYKWAKTEYQCLAQLWGKESAWNHLADNPKSTAFGIAQMLNEKSKDPAIQITNGLRYIKHRYGRPCDAWQYWRKHSWY